MKLMKKVLVLALVAATILMVACDNGNGGGGTSSSGVESGGGGTGNSGADGNGGGTNTGGDTFVPPTLSESKGTDPFAGLKTLTTDSDVPYQDVRYQVDTTKKVLTEERSKDGNWSKRAEYSYSYDGTANPPTITGRIEAQYEEGTRFTPAAALAASEAEFKADFTLEFEEIFNKLSGLDETAKEAALEGLKEQFGLDLTVADLAADKKAATLEKVWNSTSVQDMLKEERDTLKKMFSMTPTYAVTLTDTSGTTAKLAVEGQYDSTLPWHEQTAGSFSGTSSDYTAHASFALGVDSVLINDMFYQVTEITDGTITCRGEDGTSKSVSYTTTGTDKDTVVTITVDSGKTIKCTWQPSTTIG